MANMKMNYNITLNKYVKSLKIDIDFLKSNGSKNAFYSSDDKWPLKDTKEDSMEYRLAYKDSFKAVPVCLSIM